MIKTETRKVHITSDGEEFKSLRFAKEHQAKLDKDHRTLLESRVPDNVKRMATRRAKPRTKVDDDGDEWTTIRSIVLHHHCMYFNGNYALLVIANFDDSEVRLTYPRKTERKGLPESFKRFIDGLKKQAKEHWRLDKHHYHAGYPEVHYLFKF